MSCHGDYPVTLSFVSTCSNHGYDASNADMNAVFLALGPGVKSSSRGTLQPFANLEVHNLVMDLLLIPQADRVPNNVSRFLF